MMYLLEEWKAKVSLTTSVLGSSVVYWLVCHCLVFKGSQVWIMVEALGFWTTFPFVKRLHSHPWLKIFVYKMPLTVYLDGKDPTELDSLQLDFLRHLRLKKWFSAGRKLGTQWVTYISNSTDTKKKKNCYGESIGNQTNREQDCKILLLQTVNFKQIWH